MIGHCNECIFALGRTENRTHWCRRYPPVFVPINSLLSPGTTDSPYNFKQPVVTDSDSCGEFQPKPNRSVSDQG